jgi:hypothetical protein
VTTVEEPEVGVEEEEEQEGRSVELGPLFTAGAILVLYGLVRRKVLAVAFGLGAIWLDQRSGIGRAVKARIKTLAKGRLEGE